ncbi:MAG: HAMP domain-containing histidine kinase, partial [Candidatus Omnitrophica bacterium]|nr:HAMP domain-containing histidine kinase [Candidatus Omnitrophota bacterium]
CEELVYHNPNNTDIKQMIEFLKTFQSEIVIPIVQSDKLLSLVLLGKKKDRSIYTNDDLTVFTILASQAGLAIENCLFMKAEKERLEREGASARRESLDMLVSTMAHEIDNPIQGAIGQAEMLKICLGFFRSLLPTETMDEVKQYCEKIESNCMRVSKIVKAVENYSKRETGHLKIVDLEEVITPFHSLVLMIQKKYKNVKYTEDIEGSFPPVRAEEIMIEEILMNLVENAYHAVIHNDGEKTVHLHVFKKDDNYVRIDVIDNGYGIASKVKNQLFQVPTTTKGSSEGTGLGLYRIRQICEILKAKYGVESEGRGSGALFYVELPIHHKTPINKEPADEQ